MSVGAVDVAAVEPIALSVPLETPLATSFGAMDARSALLVRLTDAKGRIGWGEVWCNFPTFGALHRARLVERIVGPLLTGGGPVDPWRIGEALTIRLHTLALQTGEAGPIAQVIGGLEMAVWDLAAQAAERPVYRALGGTHGRVRAYASGINPHDAVETVRRAQDEGYRAFKLKVGFGEVADLANAAAVAGALAMGEMFMVDANQAWERERACRMASALGGFAPAWLEEPLSADAPAHDWDTVAALRVPIAAGENMRGLGAFEDALERGWLHVAQPDAGKWGGLAGGLEVARRAHAHGRRFCPHHLGGAVGLVAAAHLLAAAGGDGLLEVDTNWNPLRTQMVGPLPPLQHGAFVLPERPGLGVAPDLDALAEWRVPHR